MKYKTAIKKLKGIAKGKYCSISYTMTFEKEKCISQECGLYIDGLPWHISKTWREAFDLLNEAMPPNKPLKIEECPGEEIGEGG